MLHLLYANPWRPLDSWWQRATRLVESDGDELSASVQLDGPGCAWNKQAQRYLHALKHATTDRRRLEVTSAFPAIFQAHAIWKKLSTDERTIPWVFESRILARESDEEIGKKNACLPEVVKAYEALFFNVRSRIG